VRPHALAHVQQQRAGAAGEVEHAGQAFFLAGGGFLAIEGDDDGEDVGNLLRGVELTRLLAGTGGKLADQVFVGIAQRVDVGGEVRQPFGNFRDDAAERGIAVFVLAAEFVRAEVNLRKQAVEGALEGFVFNVFETRLQRVEQFAILGAGQVGDAVPQVRRWMT
jgi:hypothetical protein